MNTNRNEATSQSDLVTFEQGEWTERAPTEPGLYWFSGTVYGKPMSRTIIVEITKKRLCWFIGYPYPYEMTDFNGLWCGPMERPEVLERR